MAPDLRGFAAKLGSGLRSAGTGIAAAAGKAIGVAFAAGTVAAAAGLKQVIDLGISYQNTMNTLQAVTGASAEQMAAVGARAQELGSDLTLPATSAADAAQAMTELAKGGLTVEQAMTAARGTIQLAAAAQIDAGRAAEIQSNALNTFNLKADQAGHVADVLANASNAASGEITDFAQAFQSGGAVAAQFGVSIDDTATALALFANRGIQGSDAGTLLKSMLLGLTDQGKPAQAAIKELGLTVYDLNGKFVGVPALFDQLRAAAARMSPEAYQAATATLFGSDAIRAAGVAASTSRADWDNLSAAIGRQGGAADVAAAKTKGVGGALDALQSQAEGVAITLFSTFSGPLETGIRGVADFVGQVGDKLNELAQPGGLQKFQDEVKKFAEDLGVDVDGIVKFVDERVADLKRIAENGAAGLKPIAAGVGDLFKNVDGKGLIKQAATVIGGLTRAAAGASEVLGPLGQLVGGVLSQIAALPEPVKAAGLAWLAFQGVPALMKKTGTSVADVLNSAGPLGSVLNKLWDGLQAGGQAVEGGLSPLRQFSQEMRVQRALAAQMGEPISRWQAAQAAFETSTVGAVAAARSFRDGLREIKAGAEGAGAPISATAAAIQLLAERSDTVGALRDHYLAASGAVQTFGDKATAAATSTAEAFSGKLVSATERAGASIRSLPATVASVASSVASGARVVAEFPGKVAEAVASLPARLSGVPGQVGSVFSRAAESVSTTVGKITTAVGQVGPRTVQTFRDIGSSISTGLSSAQDAASRFGASVASGFTSAGAAVRDFPSKVTAAASAAGAAIRSIPAQVTSMASSTASGLASFGRSVETGLISTFQKLPGIVNSGLSGLSTFAAKAAGVGASIGTGLMRAAGSLVSFLGGPWGVALAAAGVALQIFGQQQQEAAQKAQEHQGKLEALRGTLDSYTGAVTQATLTEKANQLAKDGLLDKAKQLGINTNDYTRAALGEAGALERVQQQLDAHTSGLIASSQAYKDGQLQLQNLGLSLADLTAAANGNGPAMDKVNAAIALIPDIDAQASVRSLVDAMIAAGGSSAELGRELGISNGELAKIQNQTRLAAEAAGDFSQKLEFVKTGFAGLAAGAPQTDIMRTSLAGLAQSAGTAAQQAGAAAAQLGGVAGGAAAAEQSMQKSRDAFIQAATAAGMTQQQAEQLANQIGLIPTAANTIFSSNATGATAEIITLQAQLNAVPGTKSITVQALSDEAKAKLTELGFTITTLPNGQVQVTATTDQAKAQLDAFVAATNGQSAKINLDANPDPATGKINGTVAFANGSTGRIQVDANPDPATGKINATITYGNGQTARITMDAKPDPATGKINATVQYANGQTGHIQVDAPNVGNVSSQIDNAARKRTSVITVIQRIIQSIVGGASGGVFQPMARGGMIQRFADGGAASAAMGGKRLRKMRSGFASIVAPNTWRVIGDRLRDDEAFIPINRSQRSRYIFEETARRMGYSVARMFADGGIASGAAPAVPLGPTGTALSMVGVIGAVTALRADMRAAADQTQAQAASSDALLRASLLALAGALKANPAVSAQSRRVDAELGRWG